MQTEAKIKDSEREDNIVSFQESTIAIVSERHSDIILSLRKKDYWLAKIVVVMLNKLDFISNPILSEGINNFYLEGVDEQKLN